MIVNAYEETYSSVMVASEHTADLVPLANLLMRADHPMTCKEIGVALFGDAYVKNGDYWHDIQSRKLTAHLSQMLRHFVRGDFIRGDKIDGEPVEVEDQEYICEDGEGNTAKIRVWDKDGNEYMMPNPKYNPRRGEVGRWVKVKKTIVPKIKVYTWVVE